MTPWAPIALTHVPTFGDLKQLYLPTCTAGSGLTTMGTLKRKPIHGVLFSLEVMTDGTNGGIIELWDLNGADGGADVNTLDAITDVQRAAIQALGDGSGRMIWTQNFTGSSSVRNAIFKAIPFQHGLAARVISNTSDTATFDGFGAGATNAFTDVAHGLSNGTQIYFSASAIDQTTHAVTFTDAGDLVGYVAHGIPNGTPVQFSVITTTTGISINTTYYTRSATADTFQVAATLGGAALALTNDGTGTIVFNRGASIGFSNSTRYFIVGVTTDTFQIASTFGGSPIALIADGTATFSFPVGSCTLSLNVSGGCHKVQITG